MKVVVSELKNRLLNIKMRPLILTSRDVFEDINICLGNVVQ